MEPDVSERMNQWKLASTLKATEFPSLDAPLPSWLDKKRFRRGQAFIQEHFTLMYFLNTMGASTSFAWSPAFKAIHIADAKEMPDDTTLFLDVTNYFKVWAKGNIWDTENPAYQAVSRIQEIYRKAEAQKDKVWRNAGTESSGLFYSQLDGIATSVGLFGLALIRPEQVGLHGVPDEDLEAYAHVGRVHAYYMGVQDRFNPFEGKLDEMRSRIQQVYTSIIWPSLHEPPTDEYRKHVDAIAATLPFLSLLQGLMSPEFTIMSISGILGTDAPSWATWANWREKLMCKAFFVFQQLSRIGMFTRLHNAFIENALGLNMKYDFQNDEEE